MFSLQKFFGRDPRFFELLESSASAAARCAQSLHAILENPVSNEPLTELRQSRQETKRVALEISKLAVTTFFTVLDREDLEALANALYKIPKPIEKFAERFSISTKFITKNRFKQQDQLIISATDTVLSMVQLLKTGIHLERMRALNSKLQRIEAEADRLEVELLQDLYNQIGDPLNVFVTKDLYDLLERVIDRCRDAGNVLMHICYKNS